MADVIVKQHDVHPPLRFKVYDQDGPVDLTLADSVELILTGPATIRGPVDPIDPPDSDGFNAKFVWPSGATALIGSYRGEVEVNWDNAASPQKIETFPNTGTINLVIEADLG